MADSFFSLLCRVNRWYDRVGYWKGWKECTVAVYENDGRCRRRSAERDRERRERKDEEERQRRELREERERVREDERADTQREQWAEFLRTTRQNIPERVVRIDVDGNQNEVMGAAEFRGLREAEEVARERREAEHRREWVIASLAKYQAKEDLSSYVRRIEIVLTREGVPRRSWVTVLYRVLTGEPAAYLADHVPEEAQAVYDTAKGMLLANAGYSHEYYVKRFFETGWVYQCSLSEVVNSTAASLKHIIRRCATVGEVVLELTKTSVVHKMQPECMQAVLRDPPRNTHELIERLRQFESVHG